MTLLLLFLGVINLVGIIAHLFVLNVVRKIGDVRFLCLYLGSSVVNIVHSCLSIIYRLPTFMNDFNLFLPIEFRVFYIWLTAVQPTFRGLLCCHRFLKYKIIKQGNFIFPVVFTILFLVSLGPPASLYFQDLQLANGVLLLSSGGITVFNTIQNVCVFCTKRKRARNPEEQLVLRQNRNVSCASNFYIILLTELFLGCLSSMIFAVQFFEVGQRFPPGLLIVLTDSVKYSNLYCMIISNRRIRQGCIQMVQDPERTEEMRQLNQFLD